jgi:ubiquinone/menaquinone biosynthesis C-methylase UbiE
MMRDLDALTSTTLKHLREHWWNDAFTSFLEETLRPRPGKSILDVGSGTGTAEVSLARLRVSQLKMVGIDLVVDRLREATAATRGMNARALYAAADACHLPFADRSFDSTFCVAVLQHIRDLGRAVSELARVTRPGGRVLAVEPDNAARYWFSSVESGMIAAELGRRFFGSLAETRGESPAAAVGPMIPGVFGAHGIEPISVHLFPVSVSHLGSPPPALWESRRAAVDKAIARAPDGALRRLGADYQKAIEQYARDADKAGSTFVEIQNTMLFATVGAVNEPAGR